MTTTFGGLSGCWAAALSALVSLACSSSARDALPTTSTEASTPTDATSPAPNATQAPKAPKAPAPKAPAADDAQPCEALTRGACRASRRCTLSSPKRGVYICRAETAPCEVGIDQIELGREGSAEQQLCGERPGCQVDRGSCYCACGGPKEGEDTCTCACGGGAPASCVAAAVDR